MSRPVESTINKNDGLTDNQRKFCLAYVAAMGNVAEAARRSKLHYNTCRQYMEKPEVKQYLETLSEANQDDSIAQADEVKQFLTSVMRGEVRDQLINARSGKIEKLVPPSLTRTKAAELLGKIHGLMIQKVEVGLPIEIIVDLEGEGELVESNYDFETDDFIEV